MHTEIIHMASHNSFLELVELMKETEFTPAQDKLDKITEKMREARDLKFKIAELEEVLRSVKKDYNKIVHNELPDLMNEVSQGTFTLLAEGNYPAFTFNLKPYYKAVINNEEETAPLAYRWLDEHGEGDIIKRTVTASLGRDSKELEQELLQKLDSLGVQYDVKMGVPWNTLTAWLKERHAQYLNQGDDEHIDMPPLDLFGATIGQVAEMKEVK